MGGNSVRAVMCLTALATLVACGHPREAMPNATQSGPDEFRIVPNKPLQQPANFSTLPVPTPGGSNLTDQAPKADAVAALGGRFPTGGVDGGIVNYASRYGVDPSIRADLAKADARRAEGRRKFGLFGQRVYERSYTGYALDAYAEWERLRALGVDVPSAPQK